MSGNQPLGILAPHAGALRSLARSGALAAAMIACASCASSRMTAIEEKTVDLESRVGVVSVDSDELRREVHRVDRQVAEILTSLEAAASRQRDIEGILEQSEARHATLASTVDTLRRESADSDTRLESNIEAQGRRVDEARRAYARVLTEEARSLRVRLAEIERTVKQLDPDGSAASSGPPVDATITPLASPPPTSVTSP